MDSIEAARGAGSRDQDIEDFVHTGPNTLAGRYLRRFWQPVYLSAELKPGWSVPVRALSQDFTLYRGEESGRAFAVGHKCAHRGVQLSAGIVEGDCIRCPYHAWQYDGAGQCTEMPWTPNSFADKVRIPSWPVVERLGMIFVCFGDGAPPPAPDFSEFADREGAFQHMDVFYDHNYFHHLENSIDEAHIPVLHKLSPYELIAEVPRISCEETGYGIVQYGTRTGGARRATYFHMPNMSSWAQHPIYPEETAWREWMAWRVPVDDGSHRTIGVMHAHVKAADVPTFLGHRKQEFADLAKLPPVNGVADAVLAGKARWKDIALRGIGTDMTLIQDRVAMLGQGVFADRVNEMLGANDAAIVLLRQLWKRELRALRDGQPLKAWKGPFPFPTSGL
jgi:5,5'-dehydrodivanillate O-demethylase